MSRTVICRKYREELEGLDKPPFPGPRGEDIFENVSKKAWDAWQANQTMLIN
ncbi:MAG: oxidative damage protection protein, partial [Chromatocurvus sp.]